MFFLLCRFLFDIAAFVCFAFLFMYVFVFLIFLMIEIYLHVWYCENSAAIFFLASFCQADFMPERMLYI